MSTRLQTSVDSASIVDGVWQEKASHLGIFEQSRLVPAKRGRGNLYVLVETVGSFPDPVQIQQRIIGIVQEYYRSPGSITAGIRLAIKAANTYLFEENLNAPREERGVAGVTCMILKDEDAFIGQCGPAVLYHVGKGQYQRLPQASTWLSSKKLQDVDISSDPPLGLRRDIEPQLSHLYLREGDVFILASTSLAKLASNDEIASATLRRGAHTVRGNLESLAQGQDLSIVIVEMLGADQAPVSIEAREARVRPIDAERPGVWSRITSGLRGLLPSPEDQDEFEEELEGAFEEEQEPEGVPVSIDLRGAAESIWRFLTRLGRGLALLLSRVLPETEPPKRTKPGRKSRQATAEMDRRWLYAAVLVPVLVILLVALTRFQAERSREAAFRQLLETVQQAKASAESSPSASEKRATLAEALAVLDEALQLKPEDAELLAQQQEIHDWLDLINHVFRIPHFVDLQEFPDTESAKSQLSRVIVQGIDVFVLDLGTMRVYKYLLNERRDGLQVMPGDHVLMRTGDQRDEMIVDELLDIAWVGAGGLRGTSNLLALDTQGHVLEYDPLVGLRPFPRADGSTWVAPVAAVGYVGRLYILDPQANRVIRYVVTNAGYDGLPGDYFSTEANVNLGNAVDMAIDGNLYILHSDGRISKYQEGASADFPQTSLDEPLKEPSCIFVTGFMDEGGYVYVGDAGNQRIVQFTKAGEFIRQFRGQEPATMSDVKGLFIDEAEKELFLLDGSKLYLVDLPE
jgi:hypothetical protein